MQSSGGASFATAAGGVVNTAKASPRTRTVWRSSGGVRGSDRRNATKRSFAEGNGRTHLGANRGRTGSRTERTQLQYRVRHQLREPASQQQDETDDYGRGEDPEQHSEARTSAGVLAGEHHDGCDGTRPGE